MSEPHHGPYAAPIPLHREPRNGLGIAALVTGIVGTLFGLVPITFFIAGPLAVISIILGFAGRGRVKRGIATNGNTENPPTDDVTVDGCEVDELGFVTAPLTITNHSSEASNYLITVEVTDAEGVRLGEAYASADALRPDQSAKTDAVGLDDVSDVGEVSCTLLRVERFSAEN